MTYAEVMRRLKAAGTAQNRKIYARHGVTGALFGVSYAELGKLQRVIKTDHALAQELWASGNHDARVLAAKVADPQRATASLLDSWVKDVENYPLSDALAALAGSSGCARKRAEKWIRSRNEWIAATGWTTLAHWLGGDPEVADDELEPFIETIETSIHEAKNRVRYAMNNALIALGCRPGLIQRAIAAAKRIGPVDVDHGETGCKTPDAATYIKKTIAHRKKKAAKKRAATGQGR